MGALVTYYGVIPSVIIIILAIFFVSVLLTM